MTSRLRIPARFAVVALSIGALGIPQGTASATPGACTASLSPPAGQSAVKTGDRLSFQVAADAGVDRATFVADILRLRADGTPNQSARRVPGADVGGSGGTFTGNTNVSFAPGTERARLVVSVSGATCQSADLDVDLTPPALEGYTLVDTTHVVVSLSEPVTLLQGDQLGPEESSWRVDGSVPVDVEGAPATDTRSLRLGQAVGQDATPRVEYVPGNQAPPYADRAGNVVGAANRVANAIDQIAPAAPVITAIEGVAPGSDNEVADDVVAPDVTVGSVASGHAIRLLRVDAAGPVEVGNTVASGTSVTFNDVALGSAADGTYRFMAEATDPSANTTSGPQVSYRLDQSVPTIISAAIVGDAIQVDFSEDVFGPDLAADWQLAGPSDVVAVGDGTGPAQRILQISLPVTAGTTLRYEATTDRYTDSAGNGVPDVTLAVAALPPPVISLVPPAAVSESATSVAFTLRMSSPSALPATVEWRTVDGTATGNSDYTADSDQVVFAPNDVEETITVELRGDAVDEVDESFTVELLSSLVVARDPSRSRATASIVDDDPVPVVVVDDERVGEPTTGTQRVNLSVRLERPSGRTVTVPWSAVAGTAQAGTDFRAASGSVTFVAGATAGVIALDVLADDAGEPTEAFTVAFGTPTNATLRRPSALVTVLDADGGVPPVDLTIDRFAGTDRSGTAAAASAAVFDGATGVVIARRDLYPDALAAGPLAASLDAPVLLTAPGGLDAVTAAEIRRLGATTAHLLGGTAALGAGVERDLRDDTGVTTIERYAGTDRFDTARIVAEAIGGTRAYVVEGSNPRPDRGWPDAVSVGALAAHQRRPLLLVTRDEVPEPTMLAIERLGLEEATVVGGTASVSAAAVADLEGAGVLVDRVAGTTRYDTSLAVARLAEASGLDSATTWVATGSDFPDALAAGPSAAADGGVLMLSEGSRLSAAAATWFADHAGEVTRVVLVGGTGALGGSVEDDIRRYATVE